MDQSRPNVVIVITHDTGRHVGPYDRGVETPNLERLAAQGIVFEQAFCSAPQCSPSRASLLTGLAPHAHGLVGLTHRGFRLNPAAYERALPAVLARAGYRTHLFGFQHEAPDPHALGYQDVTPSPGRRDLASDVAATTAAFLASRPTEPFFVMAGFSETHRPFAPTDTPLDAVQVPPFLPDNPIVRRDVADLNAQVRRADEAIGRILAALHGAGLSGRTLFVYVTDHGIAFPGAKGTLLDPGLEISLIARGPGGFAGGRRVSALVSNVDVYPTILELAGIVPAPETQGRSLLPLVRSRTSAVRDAVFAELTYHTTYDPMRAIRTGRAKYIRSYAERPYALPTHVDPSPTKDYFRDQGYFARRRPPEQLFDLVRDPLERTNLADESAHRAELAELRARLHEWQRATGDPLLEGDVPAPDGAIITPLDSYEP
jgi:arylsulfatase A-like enzyme